MSPAGVRAAVGPAGGPTAVSPAVARALETATGWGYEAAWAGVRALPAGATLAAANRAADRAVRRRGPRVVQFAKNMVRVLGAGGHQVTPGELSAVVHAGLRSYARYWVETFRLPSMDHVEVAERAAAQTIGLEHIDAARAAGRGVVVVLPHSGNWDVAGLMVSHRYGGLTTVAERLKPESLYDKFVAYRESLGMEILPLTGGATPTSQILKDRLRAGGIVCLLGDRDLTAHGIPVTFFGAPTRMPAGPAMLAAVTGADLCPVHLTFTDTGWNQLIHPPLRLPGARLAAQVRGGTQLLADIFAAGIAEQPADWHMLQPLWLADLPADRRAALETGSTGTGLTGTGLTGTGSTGTGLTGTGSNGRSTNAEAVRS